jgi:Flp pilus assembly protein TadG
MAWLSNMPERRHFIHNCQAVVAIEFALLLPLLLTIFFGAFVLARGSYAVRKVDLVAHNLADLTARKADCNGDAMRTCLSAADVQDIFNAGAVLMSPLPIGSLEMTISEIGVLQGAQGRKVETSWSITRNGQMRAC